MLKRYFSLFVVGLLLSTTVCVGSASASTEQEKQARFAEKVKTGISKLGVGKEATVEVKLRDKTKLAGYVSEMTDQGFVVTSAKTGSSTNVAFADVAQVKGHNLSTGAKIAIGVAIGIGIALIVLALYINCCTG
jgi:hypothetical protein